MFHPRKSSLSGNINPGPRDYESEGKSVTNLGIKCDLAHCLCDVNDVG